MKNTIGLLRGVTKLVLIMIPRMVIMIPRVVVLELDEVHDFSKT
jgi:hypothetical protein